MNVPGQYIVADTDNVPVLLPLDSALRLIVTADFRDGGQCTAKAKSRNGQRCKNLAWNFGQVAPYSTVLVDDLAVTAYGPLPSDAAHRYLAQRCQVHDTPDADAYCDPEWVLFDPKRHADMTAMPDPIDVFRQWAWERLVMGESVLPPVPVIAAVLREHLTPAGRAELVRLLADDTQYGAK